VNRFLLLMVILVIAPFGACIQATVEPAPIGMAVEFTNHAACAYISQDKGWFEQEGLDLTAYESYANGMALAAALARGDIQVAYMCLVPAISAYSNAKLPIKIVAGTHKYGYALVVNSEKVKSVQDLENAGLRIGCVQEGGAVDLVLHKTIDKHGLDSSKVMANIQRMNPQKMALAMKLGQLDAAFMPEHWATMAESYGCNVLVMSQDVWPNMQGSVLVVKEELLNRQPDVVRRLVKVTQNATDWINKEPEDSAEVISRQLNAEGSNIFAAEVANIVGKLEVTPAILLRSMSRLDYSTDIDTAEVQNAIDYVTSLGYIKSSFNAAELLDLRYVKR